MVWVVGGPGSGRSTQCEYLQAKHGWVHISSGVLLRQEVRSHCMIDKETYPHIKLQKIMKQAYSLKKSKISTSEMNGLIHVKTQDKF